jgi:hypothetical protein
MATKKVNIDIVAKDKSKQALNSIKGNLDGLKRSVFNLKNAFIGLGAGLVIKNLVNVGVQVESLQVRLKFLFGSVEEGAKAFDNMAKFAAKVPFSLDQIQAGAGNLAVVSDDADHLAKILEITGNVAAVTGLDFVTAANQIQRSFAGGIAAADIFREKGVRDMLGFSAGATVSAEETIAAFEKVFGRGGRFGNTTDELAKTFEGTLSMLGDKVFSFKKTIVEEGFFPELKRQFGDLNKFIEENQETVDGFAKTLGTGLAIAVSKVSKALIFVNDHADKFLIALKAIIALKVATVFMGIATATMNIAKSMIALAAGIRAARAGFVGLAALVVKGGIVAAFFTGLDELFDGFLETVEEAGKGSTHFGKQLHGGMKAAGDSAKEAAKAMEVVEHKVFDIKKASKELLKENEKVFEQIKERNKTEHELIQDRVNKELELVRESKAALKTLLDQQVLDGELTQEMANIKLLEGMKEFERLKTMITKEGNAERLKLIKEDLKNLEELMQKNYDEQLGHIKSRQFKELELEKLTKEQIKDLTKATGKEALDELSKHSKAAFQINKALAMADAVVNTARGVTKALALGPFGIPLAVAIGALGAAQIATIASRKYQGRRLGGRMNQNQPYIVGEAGPEMVVPDRASNVIPNNKLGGGQPVTVNFNINTVDARGFNELLVNSRGVIVNMINNAVNEKGKAALI